MSKPSKKPKAAKAKPVPVGASRELILVALAEEKLTRAEIAAKYGVSVHTVNGYASKHKRAISEAKVRTAWPGDSNGQVKEALSRLCYLTSICSPASAKELAGAVDVVGRLNLVYDGRASTITATESKNANIDLKQFSTEDLKTLARVEKLLAGVRPTDHPQASDLAAPVIYSDTDPSCTTPMPPEEPTR